jgi:hypothetical protein
MLVITRVRLVTIQQSFLRSHFWPINQSSRGFDLATGLSKVTKAKTQQYYIRIMSCQFENISKFLIFVSYFVFSG